MTPPIVYTLSKPFSSGYHCALTSTAGVMFALNQTAQGPLQELKANVREEIANITPARLVSVIIKNTRNG